MNLGTIKRTMVKAAICQAGVLFTVGAVAAVYDIDSSHTDVGFTVKHLMISNVKGRFDKPTGSFDFDAKTKDLKSVDIEMDAASINTNDAKRDEHLKSPDFFDVAKFQKLTFKAEKGDIKRKNGKVKGKLTIHGVTKDVELNVSYNGETEFYGTKKVGFTASTKINRKDFGLIWNKPLEKGLGVTVGEEVTINIEGEGNLRVEKQAETKVAPAAEVKVEAKADAKADAKGTEKK